MSVVKMEIRIDIHEEKAGFVGVVMRGNRTLFHTPYAKSSNRAETLARRGVFRMIECTHVVEVDTNLDSYPVDCDPVGNEIMGWEDRCKLCGYNEVVYEMENRIYE